MRYINKFHPAINLDEYLSRPSIQHKGIGDRGELGRLADRAGMSSELLRGELRRRGWRLTATARAGLAIWRPDRTK